MFAAGGIVRIPVESPMADKVVGQRVRPCLVVQQENREQSNAELEMLYE
jgi:hypothetical protein